MDAGNHIDEGGYTATSVKCHGSSLMIQLTDRIKHMLKAELWLHIIQIARPGQTVARAIFELPHQHRQHDSLITLLNQSPHIGRLFHRWRRLFPVKRPAMVVTSLPCVRIPLSVENTHLSVNRDEQWLTTVK